MSCFLPEKVRKKDDTAAKSGRRGLPRKEAGPGGRRCGTFREKMQRFREKAAALPGKSGGTFRPFRRSGPTGGYRRRVITV